MLRRKFRGGDVADLGADPRGAGAFGRNRCQPRPRIHPTQKRDRQFRRQFGRAVVRDQTAIAQLPGALQALVEQGQAKRLKLHRLQLRQFGGGKGQIHTVEHLGQGLDRGGGAAAKGQIDPPLQIAAQVQMRAGNRQVAWQQPPRNHGARVQRHGGRGQVQNGGRSVALHQRHVLQAEYRRPILVQHQLDPAKGDAGSGKHRGADAVQTVLDLGHSQNRQGQGFDFQRQTGGQSGKDQQHQQQPDPQSTVALRFAGGAGAGFRG